MTRRPHQRPAEYAQETADNARDIRVRLADQLQPDGSSQPAVILFRRNRIMLTLDHETALRVARELSDRVLDHKLKGALK